MLARVPSILRGVAALFLAVTMASSCAKQGDFEPYVKARGFSSWSIAGVETTIEVSETQQERQDGLMHRDTMPADHGMLFAYTEPRFQRFWMKNTYLALDIAFISADGKITNIEQMQPLEETPGAVSIEKVPYALEMNAGWFEKHGVKAGDQLEIPTWVLELTPDP